MAKDTRRGQEIVYDLTPPVRNRINDHSARHENAGTDEISVLGLSGLLADDQHVLDAEVISASEPYAIKWGLILGG